MSVLVSMSWEEFFNVRNIILHKTQASLAQGIAMVTRKKLYILHWDRFLRFNFNYNILVTKHAFVSPLDW